MITSAEVGRGTPLCWYKTFSDPLLHREYETLDGPNLPVPGGYQALAEILAQVCSFWQCMCCRSFGKTEAGAEFRSGARHPQQDAYEGVAFTPFLPIMTAT
jgi:hypothetical protein